MKLTHATVYALHALAYLAKQEGDRPIASHLIARAQGIPELFLLKVLKQLTLSGVLRSLRGPNGGYCLARKPKDISLLDVVEAVEGPWRSQAPFESKGGGSLDGKLQAVCDQAGEAVRKQWQRVRVADLVGKA
jgi:Rrf2 family protein